MNGYLIQGKLYSLGTNKEISIFLGFNITRQDFDENKPCIFCKVCANWVISNKKRTCIGIFNFVQLAYVRSYK